MSANTSATRTPISDRLRPRFTYLRKPTALMPIPTLPERILLPEAGIDDIFEIRVAIDDATENAAFGVRWEVYCRELGFEPMDHFPDHCEHDDADLRSVQVVAYHRASGQPAGCYRLLMADPLTPATRFHVEEVCQRLTAGAIPATGDGRLGYAELSRFCIIAPFRRFDAATDTPPWGMSSERWMAEARHRRGLSGLLWLTAAHIALELRLDYLLTLMEPRLQQLGKAMGFNFTAIGEPVDFRGERVPYRIDRRALRSLLQVPQTAALLAAILPRIDQGLTAHPLLTSYLSSRTARIHR